MEINLTRNDKLELLKACQSGILNTDNIAVLKTIVNNAQPARVLTRAEAKEFLNQLEQNY